MLQAAMKEVVATMTAVDPEVKGVEGTVQKRVCNQQEEMNEGRECSQKRVESVERYGKSVTDSRTFYVDIRAA